MVDMVNVGSTMYRADQRFKFAYGDTGASGTLDAARFLQQNSLMRRISDGVWDYGGDADAANLVQISVRNLPLKPRHVRTIRHRTCRYGICLKEKETCITLTQ